MANFAKSFSFKVFVLVSKSKELLHTFFTYICKNFAQDREILQNFQKILQNGAKFLQNVITVWVKLGFGKIYFFYVNVANLFFTKFCKIHLGKLVIFLKLISKSYFCKLVGKICPVKIKRKKSSNFVIRESFKKSFFMATLHMSPEYRVMVVEFMYRYGSFFPGAQPVMF